MLSIRSPCVSSSIYAKWNRDFHCVLRHAINVGRPCDGGEDNCSVGNVAGDVDVVAVELGGDGDGGGGGGGAGAVHSVPTLREQHEQQQQLMSFLDPDGDKILDQNENLGRPS